MNNNEIENAKMEKDFCGEFSIILKALFSAKGLSKKQVKERFTDILQLGDIELMDIDGNKICNIEETKWEILNKVNKDYIQESACLCDFEIEEQ